MKRCHWLAAAVLLPLASIAADLKPVDLPAPQTDGGKPLMQALKNRQSSREFSAGKLPMQTLSNLLWAAGGVNRPDGRRTAPSAVNRQEVDIYVATADGLFLYEPKPHRLLQLSAEDVRAATGTQPFVRDAAVNLVYVADFARMSDTSAENKVVWSAADTGFIAQNVYLFCASEGLATVVRAFVNPAELAKVLTLRPEQRIILAHSVGYPAKR
jgi:SagB-type dehydrogenase family enzyme